MEYSAFSEMDEGIVEFTEGDDGVCTVVESSGLPAVIFAKRARRMDWVGAMCRGRVECTNEEEEEAKKKERGRAKTGTNASDMVQQLSGGGVRKGRGLEGGGEEGGVRKESALG